jgi:hypothetical protein
MPTIAYIGSIQIRIYDDDQAFPTSTLLAPFPDEADDEFGVLGDQADGGRLAVLNTP